MTGNLAEYIENIRSLEKFRRIKETIESSDTLYIGGIFGSAYAVLLSAVELDAPGGILFVVPKPSRAETAMDDLAMFFPPDAIALFPPPDSSEGEEDPHALNMRLSLLSRFLTGPGPRITVASIEALARPVWPKKALEKNYLSITKGMDLDIREVESWMEERGLRRVPIAESPGEWSRRGSVIDVFPYSSVKPVRIELFGDTVESIREYNPSTQVSVQELSSCGIIALNSARSYAAPGGGPVPTLLDYLPARSAVFFMNPEAMETRINEIFQKTADAKLPLMYERILSGDGAAARLFLTQMPKPGDAPGFDFNISSIEKFADLAGSLASYLDSLREKKKTSS